MSNSIPQTGTRLLYVPGVDLLRYRLADLGPGDWRLVICGPYPPTAWQFRAWLADVPEEWAPRINAARANGHCEATYTLPTGRVRVTSAASWFGPSTLPPDACRRLFERLQWHLKRDFDREKSVPLVTPAAAGVALWRAEAEDTYPELEPAEQQLIRETSGQARSEVLTLPELESIAEFGYWDMRLAYPAVSENLPVGPALHETRGFGELEVPPVGRVLVNFRAPADWQHVGLLPVKVRGERYLSSYPREGQGWCDAREARLAIGAGWSVEVLERLTMKEGRPLNTWIRRLRRLWEYFDREGETLLRDAVRSIMIKAPADMFGRGREATEERPALSGRVVSVQVEQRRRTERVSHPEWAAAIWARTRYRLAKYLLAAPRELLLGCHLDCAYTSGDPGWSDRGQWGDMRLKGALAMQGPAPRSMDELKALAKVASRGADLEEGAGDELAD